MTFMIPTGRYATRCPFDVVRADVTACVGMGLPDGNMEKITVSETYRTETGKENSSE